MNMSLFKRPITLVLIFGLFFAVGISQAEPPGPPPNIEILVSVDQPAAAPYYPGDPIWVNLSVANVGADEFMRKGWKALEFWLLLQFYDEKGRLITSDEIVESSTLAPPPPRVFPDENAVLIQGTLVELVEGDGFESEDWPASFTFNAYDYYPLEGRSGLIRFKAVVPTITFQADKIEETPSGIKYAPRYPIDTTKWSGDVQSGFASFTLVGDFDEDGYYYPHPLPGTNTPVDCDDNDASVNPGAAEIPNNDKDDNCDGVSLVVEPVAGSIAVNFDHFILAAAPSKKGPAATQKEPCAGAKVAVFDINSECVSNLGLSWENYEQIMTQCGQVALCDTNASGECVLQVPPGTYHIIGEFESGGEKHYSGVSAGSVAADATVQRFLSLLTGDGQTMPGEYHLLTGSQLLIMQPQYMKWPSGQEKRACPFVFESIGNWTVDIELDPPKRFIASPKAIDDVEVNSELKAFLASINKTPKAKSGLLKVKYIIKHANEKKKKIIETTIDMEVSK